MKVVDIAQRAGGATVYNFEVADNHNYFVGQAGLLVHNQCGLATILRANNRTFRRFLESLQGEAARAGRATRTIEETRQILDEAIRRGFKAPRGVETEWVGGRHINLYGPKGESLHFPLPDGFVP